MTAKELAAKNPKGLIGRAFEFAKIAHAGQSRLGGQSHFEHCLEVAEFLNQWHLDESTIAAGLLHDVTRKTSITLDEIKREFGEDIARLTEGVAKLDLVKYASSQTTKTKIENLRKMILALSGDLRIVFIKLAACLHNMKTLGNLPQERQTIPALETQDIYAPLAMQIGMQNLAGELYDLSFPILNQEGYEWLLDKVKDRYETRQAYLESIRPTLQKMLADHGLKPHLIDFRAKRYSSLYRKLPRYDMNLEQIYDLIAVWVVLNTVEECYEALGVIHKNWPPLPGRIKDYIAIPKPSGYRAIHTTVIGPEDKNIEIQIHTRQMHEENKNGLAAHWLYKQNAEKGKKPSKKSIRSAIEEALLLKHLRRWQNQESDPAVNYEEFVRAMQIDFFNDRIFVITPKGDVIDLPAGSTPIDFAYKIHTEIGNACSRAKINNKFQPLKTKLKSGDLVEIVTQKGKKPSEEWLDQVKTPEARMAIKSFLREKKGRLTTPLPPRYLS